MTTLAKIILVAVLNIGLMFSIVSAQKALAQWKLAELIKDVENGPDLRQHCKDLILNDSVLLSSNFKTNRAKAKCHSELTY